MKNEVIEILTQYLTEERLSKIIAQNEEYKSADYFAPADPERNVVPLH